jgi:hypothetical protein
MQATLTINGVDFAAWAQQEGIEQEVIQRQGREVVTLDGVLYTTWIEKRGITWNAVELRDDTLATLMAALSTNPATVTYTDAETGTSRTSIFYVKGKGSTEKVVVGGNTYYTGFSVELEER